MIRLQRATLLLTLFAALSAGVAHAGTIVQFDGFPTGDFSSGSNNGFTINATLGFIWGNTYGFPGNSAGVPFPDTESTYTFTDGGNFTFLSIDIDVGGSEADFSVGHRGWLFGSLAAGDGLFHSSFRGRNPGDLRCSQFGRSEYQ